uniref:Uncharacterized protein n=1 Tax=Hyaloperonospora arabidopsidis (strain Emoy2) TaxID=559515 RepID=M4BX22_HYAAE
MKVLVNHYTLLKSQVWKKSLFEPRTWPENPWLTGLYATDGSYGHRSKFRG